LKKLLAAGVIVLFLGLACAPSINANVSKESELVEITTEVFGLNGGKHTVQLTLDEVEEVDRLFEDLRCKFNKSKTTKEIIKIFNETVVELNKYGLLGGLTIQRAQILVNKMHQNPLLKKLLDKKYGRGMGILDNVDNAFCFINGASTNTYSYFLPFGITASIIDINLLLLLLRIPQIIHSFIPLKLLSFITWGYCIDKWDDSIHYDAEGLVQTRGLRGYSQPQEEKFYGGFDTLEDFTLLNWITNLIFPFTYYYCYIGVIGFTGIFIRTFNKSWYFGRALLVSYTD